MKKIIFELEYFLITIINFVKILYFKITNTPYTIETRIRAYSTGQDVYKPAIIQFLSSLSNETIYQNSEEELVNSINILKKISNEKLKLLYEQEPCELTDIKFELDCILAIIYTYESSKSKTFLDFDMNKQLDSVQWKIFYETIIEST